MFALRDEIRRLAAREDGGRLVVVRAGALGDTILLLPTLRRIEQELPRATLTLVGSHWAGRLMPMMAGTWRFFPFDDAALAPLFAPDAAAALPAPLAEADLLIVYSSQPDGAFVGNLRRLCEGDVIAFPVDPPPGIHAACHFASAVADGVPDPEQLPVPELRPREAALQSARAWLTERFGDAAGRTIVVHPGSGTPRKCWPARRFVELIERLIGSGATVVLLRGPADDSACRAVQSSLGGEEHVPVAQFADLEAVAGLIRRVDAFVGNDSGVAHLAAALGTPTVAIFGPTDPAVWRPLGEAVTVLGVQGTPDDPATWPAVDDVLRAVLNGLWAR